MHFAHSLKKSRLFCKIFVDFYKMYTRRRIFLKCVEGEEILSTLRRIQLQLECAQSAFEDVTDESLIDSYIYEIIALQKKYEYFLRAAKKMGLTNGVQRRAI